MTEQVMPSAINAEAAILGAVILENELWYEASSTLQPDQFYSAIHRVIYEAMGEMMSEGRPIDTLTLGEHLGKHKKLGEVGGIAAISNLTEGVPRRTSVASYVEMVKDKAKLRKIINSCAAMQVRASEGADEPDDLAAELTGEMLEVCGEEKGGICQIGEGTDASWQRLEEREKKSTELVGLPLGVPAVDSQTGGICKSEIFVVAARPSVGKTGFAGKAAHVNVMRETPVGIFSLEMTKEQLHPRLWALESGVPYWRIEKPWYLSTEEKRKVRNAAIQLKTYPLYVDDSSHLDIARLVARAVLMVKRYKTELIIVDYLGKINAPGKTEYEQVTKAIRSLTQFAKDYCPVLCLSQLARPTEHNIGKKPNYLDLRSSGQIEADAHTILLLHREVDKDEKYTENGEIIIAKNRRGEQGTEIVKFNKDMVCFEGSNVQ